MSNTSDEVGHTATPWEVNDTYGWIISGNHNCIASYRDSSFISPAEKEKNATFIVNAVNSHDSLVKALETAVNDIRGGALDPDDFPWMQEAIAALSQAKGGK